MRLLFYVLPLFNASRNICDRETSLPLVSIEGIVAATVMKLTEIADRFNDTKLSIKNSPGIIGNIS